jgi:oxygen-independent coproporphyrinogen III oxidase
MNELVRKYNLAGPRYTSYPPVPFWKNNLDAEQWKSSLVSSVNRDADNGVSLYIHLPFCESLCTYCGCNTRITVNHSVEIPYIEAVLKEWNLYRSLFDHPIKISEIHLGGGTPTFFSASNLQYLLTQIIRDSIVAPDAAFSIEGHPNSTTLEQLKVLSFLGFRRISFGIQDFDPRVQKAIHRFQSYDQVKKVTELSRQSGFDSVNYDLIYGLPFQTTESIGDTFEQVVRLRPDRIAYYGYAHVPWIKPGQRSYSDSDLPDSEKRLEMYEAGRQILESAGYVEIGMDHFALKTDSLYRSLENGTLNRNFMGYTDSPSNIIIGLGVSSISDNGDCYAQNVKTVEEYYEHIQRSQFPVFRGHILDETDKRIRNYIKELMCSFRTSLENDAELFNRNHERLLVMEKDGIIRINDHAILVTQKGHRFVRNICMAIDPLTGDKENSGPVFSATV